MMTTATRSDSRVPPVGAETSFAGILGRVLVVTFLAGVAMAALGGLLDGRDGALGAAAGAGIVLGVLAFGCGSLAVVARVQPSATLLVALVSYLVQAVLLLLVFVRLTEVPPFDDGSGRVWLAIGLVAGTLAWLTAQLVLTVRQRIPYYDLTGGQQ